MRAAGCLQRARARGALVGGRIRRKVHDEGIVLERMDAGRTHGRFAIGRLRMTHDGPAPARVL